VPEIGRMAGLQWNALSDEDKKPFQKLAEDSKKIYESRMEEWNKKGSFKFEDGTLSTHPRNLDRVCKMECPKGTAEPKKVRSAYLWFANTIEFPLTEEMKKDVTKRSKLAGEKW